MMNVSKGCCGMVLDHEKYANVTQPAGQSGYRKQLNLMTGEISTFAKCVECAPSGGPQCSSNAFFFHSQMLRIVVRNRQPRAFTVAIFSVEFFFSCFGVFSLRLRSEFKKKPHTNVICVFDSILTLSGHCIFNKIRFLLEI